MAQLSNRLQRLAPSATLAMSQKSAEMKAQGIDVINMSVGEPDFNTPDHIKKAAKLAVDQNFSRYSPVPGYADLRQAIVKKLHDENGLDYTVGEVLVSNGAKQSVCNTVMALVNPGEEVIIPAPYWVSYPQMALLAGGKPVFVEATFEQNFKMTPQQLEAAITPNTRLIILCSPSNPTGSVYNKEELHALANIILKYDDLYVLADEIYEHINYVGRHESIAQFPGMKERTIVVNGVPDGYSCDPAKVEAMISDLILILSDGTFSLPLLMEGALAGKLARLGAAEADPISSQWDASKLMEALFASGNAEFTPSGKRIISELSEGQIEKLF